MSRWAEKTAKVFGDDIEIPPTPAGMDDDEWFARLELAGAAGLREEPVVAAIDHHASVAGSASASGLPIVSVGPDPASTHPSAAFSFPG